MVEPIFVSGITSVFPYVGSSPFLISTQIYFHPTFGVISFFPYATTTDAKPCPGEKQKTKTKKKKEKGERKKKNSV